MKVYTLLSTLALSYSVFALPTVASNEAVPTDMPGRPGLEKRGKEVVVNKEYQKLQDIKNGKLDTTSETPKPWVRTIYTDKVEIVTPTVIAGVTISGKPPATTDGLEPWISLNGDGSPKTINPKMKNGVIKNKSPDYATWFQEVKTVTYSKEELRAHNMNDDEIFVEEQFIPEDLTYRLLNPIIRCTPESYKKKGVAKNKSPEPFCFPRDNSRLYMDQTYFITWYYPFFDKSVEKVRLHLSYVKESIYQKGMKRDVIEGEEESDLVRRSSVMEKGGKISQGSFFMSDWMAKEEGMIAITVDPEWFGEKDYYHKVLLSLQPDTLADDEFQHMENFIVIEIAKKARVAKGHYLDLKEQDELAKMKEIYGDSYDIEEGINFDTYITIVTLPTCVLVAVLLMYLFVAYNNRQNDLSFLKKVKFNRNKTSLSRKIKNQYSELPQWNGEKKD